VEVLIKAGTTLLLLTAAVGMVRTTADGLTEEARGMVTAHAANLESLEARWARLGVPPRLTAPAAAIPAVVDQTMALPARLTDTASDLLEPGAVQTHLVPTATASIAQTETAVSEKLTETLVASSGKIVAMGTMAAAPDGPTYTIQNARPWNGPDDAFYVHVRFIDLEGRETAYATQRLSAEGPQTWTLDPSAVPALPPDWHGIALATVHDDVADGPYDLSEEYRIKVTKHTSDGT